MNEKEVSREKIISVRGEVKRLLRQPRLENLEMAAQLLEDNLGPILKWFIKGMLELPEGRPPGVQVHSCPMPSASPFFPHSCCHPRAPPHPHPHPHPHPCSRSPDLQPQTISHPHPEGLPCDGETTHLLASRPQRSQLNAPIRANLHHFLPWIRLPTFTAACPRTLTPQHLFVTTAPPLLPHSHRVQVLNGHAILSNSSCYPEMAGRLLMVKHLPVSGILTTNYDQLLCLCKAEQQECFVCGGVTPQAAEGQKRPEYLRLIRHRSRGAEDRPEDKCIMQIHGSTSDPQSIVLTVVVTRSLTFSLTRTIHLAPILTRTLFPDPPLRTEEKGRGNEEARGRSGSKLPWCSFHKGAYRALCTRCAKSWLFSTTGSSVSSED